MKGFFKKVLQVDVTSRSFREETLPEDILLQVMGGKGLGSYLLRRQNPPGVDPFSPENHLIFTTGCATDTPLYGSARYGVYTKSPQTGIYSESYSGGRLALALSRTGYDALVVRGAAEVPLFLEVMEGGVAFHSAGEIWGQETFAAERYLKKAGGAGAEALVIGPAGENQVRFSVLEHACWRSAGRTGVGAVLGAKRVKGIVFHGTRRRPVARRGDLVSFGNELRERLRKDPTARTFGKFGTSLLVSIMNTMGGFPTRYWSEGRLENWETISGDALQESCHIQDRSCPRCFLGCSKISRVKSGKYKGLRVGGPEYQTIYAFGGLCLIGSIEEIIYLNDLCDRLGLDTITAGNLVAFAIEASLRKMIPEKLEYGDTEGIARLLEKIARREGIGADLAEGIRPVSRKWRMEGIAVHVKGLEPPGYDPRALPSMGLAYATADRGACHSRSSLYLAELRGEADGGDAAGKARLLIEREDRLTVLDTIILCRFYDDFLGWPVLERILELLTGEPFPEDRLRRLAQTIADLVRSFNLQEGVSRMDDSLPGRFLREALGKEKRALRREELEGMLAEYYRLRGWDDQGRPPRPRIEPLRGTAPLE